jgi:hypothetical protein
LIDQGRKVLSSRAEEQDKGVGAALRRPDGFGAPPAPAAALGASSGGFGRRATPIPATTNGMPPLTVANDRTAPADDGIELSFAAEQSVETRAAETRTAASDESDPLAGELVDWLQLELRRGRDVQQEAVLCALGALAGYAAQQALWEGMVKPGKLAIAEAFKVMETPSGATYFFGDTLDSLLVSMEPKHVSVWKIVAGGVLAAGGEHLPNTNDLLRHCAATAGTSAFGLPRLPDDHLPSILPRAAVERFWPGARLLLSLADPLQWPLLMAHAAQKLMLAMKGSIAPDLAVKIVMEAAVPMSRVDPTTVPND